MCRVPITGLRAPILTSGRYPVFIKVRVPVKGIRKPISANNPKAISPEYLDVETLMEKFTPLMRSIYKLFSSYNGIFVQQADYDDLYSQIQLEFIKLCREYDPTRGVDFPGYIKFHLQNRVYHYVTKEQRRQQKEQTAKSFGYDYDDKPMDMENYPELIDMDALKAFEKADAIASLDWRAIVGKKHRALIEGVLFKNKTLEEMAEEEGVTMKVMRLRLHFACIRLTEWAKEMEDYTNFHNESANKR